ncbi:MAG: hypothetical protein ACFFFC_09345 [Candidatus Thorarchaeota archaeon]
MDQIDRNLVSVPIHWNKVRGRSWNSRLTMKSKVNRRIDGRHLIIWEWELLFKPEPLLLTAMFWIDSNLEGSEVFVICPTFGMSEIFVHSLLMALLKIEDPSQVDVSSFLAQNQT